MLKPTDAVMILCVQGVQLIDVAGPLDVLDTTNRILGYTAYATSLTSLVGGTVVAGNGIQLATTKASEVSGVDTLIVPGSFTNADALTEPDFSAAIRETARSAGRLISICNGAFALAHVGLLDGRRVATHWAMCDDLAEAYPLVDVDHDALYVDDNTLITSGGASTGADLAVAIVAKDHGADVAAEVARWLVMYRHRPGGQSQFVSTRQPRPTTAHAAVGRAIELIADDPTDDHRVETLAARVGLSRRHFARLFRSEIGATVARYVDRVRFERAVTILETTIFDLETVARMSGYSSSEVLRQVFQRERGITPGQHRTRFGNLGA